VSNRSSSSRLCVRVLELHCRRLCSPSAQQRSSSARSCPRNECGLSAFTNLSSKGPLPWMFAERCHLYLALTFHPKHLLPAPVPKGLFGFTVVTIWPIEPRNPTQVLQAAAKHLFSSVLFIDKALRGFTWVWEHSCAPELDEPPLSPLAQGHVLLALNCMA